MGIVVDADDRFISRWNRLKELCRELTDSIPEELPSNGMIHVTPRGLRIGVWIMPDNSSRGMMETFLARLLSTECAAIWEFAKKFCEQVGNLQNSHHAAHREKAEIHTYLAWIEPPPQSLPEAIIRGAISPRHEMAQPFAAWVMKLFQLTPRPELSSETDAALPSRPEI
jgi:hypothetical protein